MTDKMLNKRQKDIISILNENKNWIKGKQLAQLVGVSDRTIRSDIDVINKLYENEMIISNMRKGYMISQDKYLSIHKEMNSSIPQTPEQRCLYILQQLLIHEDGLNLTFLQEDIYVSGYSIENDIKRVRNALEKYPSLRLDRMKNYIYLKGDEIDKRQLYKELLAEEIQGQEFRLREFEVHDEDLSKCLKYACRAISNIDKCFQ